MDRVNSITKMARSRLAGVARAVASCIRPAARAVRADAATIARELRPTWSWIAVHKLTSAALAGIMVAGIVCPVLDYMRTEMSYRLADASTSLIGHTTNLSEKLQYDKKTQIYRFNSKVMDDQSGSQSPAASASSSSAGSADPAAGSNTAAASSIPTTSPATPDTAAATQQLSMKNSVGGADKKDDQLYAVDIPTTFAKGVKFADANTKLSFSLIPQFKADDSRLVDGHLLYPVAGGASTGGAQAVYSLKNNGIKEDIILLSAPAEGKATYSYKLDLPNTLEARLLPNGSVGIYSADPALFGNITAGTPDDQKRIDAARKNAVKNYLVFGLPAPVIRQSGKSAVTAKAKFELDASGKTLRVVATGLDALAYPVSIDPSVVVTSTADFALGNNEGNIDFPTDQINRGAVSGGSVGAWAANTNFSSAGVARHLHSSVVYNGFVYVIGGTSAGTTYLSNTLYASLGSGGTIGTWALNPTNFTGIGSGARYGHTSVAYNGYVYVIGGYNGAALSDIVYALICTGANNGVGGCGATAGTLGTWTANATGFTGGGVARYLHSSVVYNGYVYNLGGTNTGAAGLSDTMRAPLNADGTVGTWVADTGFGGAGSVRRNLAAAVYNGYVYVIGGYTGSLVLGDVLYAPLNANGTIGTWAATASFNGIGGGARSSHAVVISEGYMYITGGYNGAAVADTLYAPINASGTLVSWNVTSSFSGIGNGSRENHTSVVYNGYVYLLGGTSTLANYFSDTLSAKVNTPGALVTTTWNVGTTFGTARWNAGSAVYNGYIYIVGGYSGAAYLTDVQYAPLNANGTIGTFASTTAPYPGLGRTGLNNAITVYNGFLYVTGGHDGTSHYNTTLYAPLTSTGNITAGTWATTTNAFTTGRYHHASVVNNGYLYVMGGNSASGHLNDVQYALICTGSNSGVGGCNATAGNVGTWASSTSFTGIRWGLSDAVYNGYLYILGGNNGATYYNDVQYALICTGSNSGVGGCGATAGTVGTWTTNANSFTTGRYLHQTVVYNGCLYVIDGTANGTVGINDVQYAPINANGSVGTWVATTATTTSRWGGSAAVNNGYIYSLGGRDSATTTSNTSEWISINNGGNGTTGTWTASGSSFSAVGSGARRWHASVAYNGFVYVMAGTSTDANYFSDVLYAPIASAGNIGSWTTTTSFSGVSGGGRISPAAVAYNGYIYMTGGSNAGGFLAETLSTLICTGSNSGVGGCGATAGTVGTWSLTSSFAGVGSGARSSHASLVYNGYIYITGGSIGATNYSDVLYALICTSSNSGTGGCTGTPGTVGTWAATTGFSSVGAARLHHTSVAYNGFIYVMGGSNGGPDFSDVLYAPINANGTVGIWATTTGFKGVGGGARNSHTSVVYNGCVYIMGGSGAFFSDTIFAPLSENGAVGPWAPTVGFAGVGGGGRFAHTMVAYNGYVYIMGGYNGGNLADTIYTPLTTQPRIGNYSKLIDLGSSLVMTGLKYNGTLLGGGAVHMTYRTAATSAFGAATTVNNLAPNTSIPLSGAARYILVSAEIDDTYGAGVADAIAGQSFITDITLDYIAAYGNPSLRLFNGKFFYNNVLQPLNPQ